jgi:hypothetical protein
MKSLVEGLEERSAQEALESTKMEEEMKRIEQEMERMEKILGKMEGVE